MIIVEIWTDFACPFCYIGKTRFEEALAEFKHRDEVEVLYKAYQLNPYAPKLMDSTAAKTFASIYNISESEALERFAVYRKNAEDAGLEYNYDIIQMTNTFDAHRLAKYANILNLEPELTTRFMQAYFTEGRNLADSEVLVELAAEVGLDSEAVSSVLSSDQYADLVRKQMLESQAVGANGVPYFVIDRKYAISGSQPVDYFKAALDFAGREHHKPKILPLETKNAARKVCDDDKCE